jgi:hypothetical protein
MSKLKYDESFAERAGECAAKGLNNIRPGQMHRAHRNLSRRRFPQNHRTPAWAQSESVRYWLAGGCQSDKSSQSDKHSAQEHSKVLYDVFVAFSLFPPRPGA